MTVAEYNVGLLFVPAERSGAAPKVILCAVSSAEDGWPVSDNALSALKSVSEEDELTRVGSSESLTRGAEPARPPEPDVLSLGAS